MFSAGTDTSPTQWHNRGSKKTSNLLKDPALQPLIYRINLVHTQRENRPIPLSPASHYYCNPLFVFIHGGEGDRGPNWYP